MKLLRPAQPTDDEYGLNLVPLTLWLIKELGPEYVLWESEVVRAELVEKGFKIGPLTWERIQAGRLLLCNDAFWQEWEVFEKVSVATAGEIPIFNLVQPLEAEDMAVSMHAAAQFLDHPYTDEVKRYIAASCLNDGLWYLEPPLDVAKDALANHDKAKGITRDLGAVQKLLEGRKDYIQNPETSIEVQVNHALSVRKALTEYAEQVAQQIADLKLEKVAGLATPMLTSAQSAAGKLVKPKLVAGGGSIAAGSIPKLLK